MDIRSWIMVITNHVGWNMHIYIFCEITLLNTEHWDKHDS